MITIPPRFDPEVYDRLDTRPDGYDTGTIAVRDSVSDKAQQVYRDFDRSIFQIETSDGVLDNPYAMTDREITYYALYMSGSNPVNGTNRAALEAAYNKYQNALKWYSDQQALIENREYNSPVSESERMASAGINSALNGVTSEPSGTAVDGTSPTPSPSLADSNPLSTAVSVVGGVVQLASAVTSTISTVQSMSSVAADVENKKLKYTSDLLGSVMPGLISYLPDEAFNKGAKLTDYFTEDYVTGAGFSSDDYKTMSGFLGAANIPQQSRAAFQESLTKALSQRLDRVNLSADPLRPGYENRFYLDYIRVDSQARMYKAMSDKFLNQFQSEYNAMIDPELAADAANSSNTQIINDETLQDYEMRMTVARNLPQLYLLQQSYNHLQSSDPISKVVGMSLYNSVFGLNGSLYGAAYSALGGVGAFAGETGLTGQSSLLDGLVSFLFEDGSEFIDQAVKSGSDAVSCAVDSIDKSKFFDSVVDWLNGGAPSMGILHLIKLYAELKGNNN